ncbi:hypothetical protein MHU86_16709 [Fragilaria crotonensis]|nr:hypothetical protein MHU86_16709 [Fragilaria crotonensis]
MECHIRRRVSAIRSSSPQPNLPDGGIACNEDSTIDDDHVQLLLRSLNTTTHGTPEEQSLGSFTRRKLRRLPNWKEWQDAEFKQLDSMAKQEMYGALFLLPEMLLCSGNIGTTPSKATVRKARNCCDGSLAQLHSSSWLTPILAASNNLVCAFSLLCVLMRVILYQGTWDTECLYVAKLTIWPSDVNVDAIKDLVRVICAEDGIDLRDEGILNSFNGVDVDQRDRYIKITCETYIDKLLAHYGWSSSGSRETDETHRATCRIDNTTNV